MGWIALQHIPDNDETFGFVIGNGFASVTLTAARSADDELIRQLAGEILGFPVGSVKDWQRQLDAVVGELSQVETELTRLEARRAFLQRQQTELSEQLLAAKIAERKQ